MLKKRFTELLLAIGASIKQANTAWEELSTLYQEKGRAYHSLSHISHMLDLMDEHISEKSRSIELELAIWYHDVIYDPLSKENEVRSADLAKRRLSSYSILSDESLESIYLLILSTQGHTARIDGEGRLQNEWMLDLDLSILGAEKEGYKLYTQQIRQEYHMYSPEDYKMGRSQVLKSFLQRKEIYFSDLFKQLFEEKARENLRNEIEDLSTDP